MELVGAGFRGHNDLTAAAASEGRVIVAALEGELANRVDAGRVQQGSVGTAVVDVSAVHSVIIGSGTRAVHGDRSIVGETKTNLIRQLIGYAGLQQNELLEVPIVQGQFTNLVTGHGSGLFRSGGLDGTILG